MVVKKADFAFNSEHFEHLNVFSKLFTIHSTFFAFLFLACLI